jgi:hypothetical protein
MNIVTLQLRTLRGGRRPRALARFAWAARPCWAEWRLLPAAAGDGADGPHGPSGWAGLGPVGQIFFFLFSYFFHNFYILAPNELKPISKFF